jgi:hypothetical protein
LGLNERKGKFFPVGVSNAPKIIKEFWDQINNRQKVSLNILFDKDVIVLKFENKTFILISVPRANRQEKPVFLNNNILTGTFRRNFEGDYRCNETEVKAMLRDQADVSADFSVFNEIDYNELISDTFRRYRIRFNNVKPGHIWNNLSDTEFLLKVSAVRRIGNMICPTLAVFLCFAMSLLLHAFCHSIF